MSDHTNDIDALVAFLMRVREGDDPWCDPDHAKDWSRALTALVAERDAAIKERDGYLEGNRQALRALAEANEIAARYKAERDEARRDACAFEAIVRWNEAHPKGIMSPCAVERISREIAVDRGWDCYKEGGGA